MYKIIFSLMCVASLSAMEITPRDEEILISIDEIGELLDIIEGTDDYDLICHCVNGAKHELWHIRQNIQGNDNELE